MARFSYVMTFLASHKDYQRLKEEQDSSKSQSGDESYYQSNYRTWPQKGDAIIFLTLLILSNVSTWFLCSRVIYASFQNNIDFRTPYAHLERNVPVAFQESTSYTDHNKTSANKLWDDINIDAGMVALPEEFARANGLPIAQRFAWDPSKGIYLLNGHHNLHCIRAIYISLMEFWEERPQSRAWGHVLHCVDTLRLDIICNADDTPRYSTATKSPESGMGQVRQCRSWDKLEKWARHYNSCYKFVNQTAEDLPEIQRFIYCPKDSPYRTEVEKVFGRVPAYEEL